jgi:hypothetical protein
VERISGAGPLNFAVGADLAFYSDGWALVFPDHIDVTSPPPEGVEHLQARNHLFEAGAFDLRESHLLLTLEGRSVEPVRVIGLRSRVIARYGSLSGAVVRSPSAGEHRIADTHFDLDDDESSARVDDGQAYFHSYTITLGRGESFMFRIMGRVEHTGCEWELLLSYSHGGTDHELVIDNAGRPFRTAARDERSTAVYDWAWYEQPSRLVPRGIADE